MFAICLSAAFLLKIYSGHFFIPEIPYGGLFGGAVLLGIGLEILVPKHGKHFGIRYTRRDNDRNFEMGHVLDEEGNVIEGEYKDNGSGSSENYVENNFGTTVKYFDNQDFTHADVECNFGSTKAYFINATMLGSEASINIDNNFGSTEVYIPKEWHVDLKKDNSFGSIDEQGDEQWDGVHTVHIFADSSFGRVVIVHA